MTESDPTETVRSRIGIKTLREFVAEAKKRGCSLGDCARPSRQFRTGMSRGSELHRIEAVPVEDVLLERITELAAALHRATYWADAAVTLPTSDTPIVVARMKGKLSILTVFHYEVRPDMEWRTIESLNAAIDPCLRDTATEEARDAYRRGFEAIAGTHLRVDPPPQSSDEVKEQLND